MTKGKYECKKEEVPQFVGMTNAAREYRKKQVPRFVRNDNV